jgi:signal transduction histidine kinase
MVSQMSSCSKSNIILAAVLVIGLSLFQTDQTKTIDELVAQNNKLQSVFVEKLEGVIAENEKAAKAHQEAAEMLKQAIEKTEEERKKLPACR